MTSFRSLATTCLLVLIYGCSGGGDSSRNVIENPPEPPQDGISGTVQSRISGARITVVDANGQDVTVASGGRTDGSGSYSLVFSEFSIQEGITAPLIVTIDGSGATALCDYNRDGENDCQDADGSFVAYGETYTLANNFTLRGITSTFPPESTVGDRRVTVNISAASDIAVSFALTNGETTLSGDAVETAMAQALGFVEFISGLPTGGEALNDISLANLAQPVVPETSSLAIGMFSAGLHGQVVPTVTARANYRRVLNEIEARIVVNPASGQVESTGGFLSETVNNYLTAAISFQNSLAVASPVLAGAISSQFITLQLLDALGSTTVAISQPADPDSDVPLERSKVLVNRLTEAMGAVSLISTTNGFGGTRTGAATVFVDQVSLVSILASREVRNTLLLLDTALANAQASGETQLTGTNVSGVLEFDGDDVIITTATSTTSNIQTGISVNISIQDGRRSNPGGGGEFTINDITIGVTQTQNNVTTQQLFEGTFSLTMIPSGSSTDATALAFSGDLRAQSGLTFTGDIGMTNLTPVDATPGNADFDADFVFSGQSDINMVGTLAGGIDTYTVSTSNGAIVADLETNVITDLSAELNLSLDASGSVVTGGTFTAGGETTGAMDALGIVGFDDGTAVVLPTPVI